ncbi:MAG: pyridoxal phosphate-dependent aminotransferase [Desulfobulbus sp.]
MSAVITLAQRVEQIAPSPTLAINAKAKQLKAAGVDVLNFSVGEPDFPTPDHICSAGKAAIDDGHTRYTAANGILELREAVCARYRDRMGLHYDPEQIQISCGGKQGLYNIFQALLNPGDEVLIPTPYWVSYPPIVELASGVPVSVPLREEKSFDLDAEDLRQHASSKTKVLILNSPSNPTGSVNSEASLKAVAQLARERGWLIVSDDIYEEIVYTTDKAIPHILHVDPTLQEQTILCNGVSKSYSMTGWRIGWCAGPLAIIKAMNKVQSQSVSNPVALSQYAALAALSGPQDFPQTMLAAFFPRRDFFVQALNSIRGVNCVAPMGAFYVFPNFSAYYGSSFKGKPIDGSVALADYFLEEARVATVPGAAFGADAFIRFSFATSLDTIKEGMRRIEQALAALEQ